jgi:hypothetical protein
VNNVKISNHLEKEIRKFQTLDLPKELKKMQHVNHQIKLKIKAHRKQLKIALKKYMEAFQDQRCQTKIYKDMVLQLHALTHLRHTATLKNSTTTSSMTLQRMSMIIGWNIFQVTMNTMTLTSI